MRGRNISTRGSYLNSVVFKSQPVINYRPPVFLRFLFFSLCSLAEVDIFYSPNMIESHSHFIESTLIVGHNAVKSILFRLAELFLGFAVYKYFSFAALKLDAFTSYLLFREDMIQKGLFVFSSRFSRAGVLVLLFGLVIVVADLYGTLLWSLDAPGWHVRKYNASARAIYPNLLEDAGYVVQIRSQPGNIRDLDAKLPDIIGTNFVKPGVNFTLLGINERAQPKVAKPSQPFDKAWARIWVCHVKHKITVL